MAALDLEAPAKTEENAKANPVIEAQTYTTVLGTVKDGKLVFPQDIQLPEGTAVLITILQKESIEDEKTDNKMDITDLENMSLGEHLIAAYKDVAADRYTSVKTDEELTQYVKTLAI